jgi:rare lipoprotein A
VNKDSDKFRISCFLLLIAVVFFTACSTSRYSSYPKTSFVTASWYGSEFHGRPTASGEIFDMNALTCAHREYPFGTRLKVTNVSNNSSVVCLVNDRGPFVSGRDIDLSYGTAKKINMMGTGRVRIEYAGRDQSYIRTVRYQTDRGPFAVQVGSFRESENASRLKKSLELKYGNVQILEAKVDGDRYYRVRIGKFSTKDRAYRFAKDLAEEGYGVIITSYEEKI